MKKEYITPEIRVTELTEDMTILAGSDTTSSSGGYEDEGVEDLGAKEIQPIKCKSVWD